MAPSSDHLAESEQSALALILPEDPACLLYLQCCALIDEAVEDDEVAACLVNAKLLQDTDLAGVAGKLRSLGLTDGQNRCKPMQLEPLAREAARQPFFKKLAASVRMQLPTIVDKIGTVSVPGRIRRDLRLAILDHDMDRFNSALLHYFNNQDSFRLVQPVPQICNNPFEAVWFGALPAQIKLFALHEIYKQSLLQLGNADRLLAYFNDRDSISSIPAAGKASFYYLHIVLLLLRGDLAEAREVIRRAGPRTKSFGLSGWLHFLLGNVQDALSAYEEDLQLLRRINNKKNAYFTGIEGLFYLIALLMQGDFFLLPKVRQIIADLEQIQPHNIFLPCYQSLKNLVECQENPLRFRVSFPELQGNGGMNSMATLIRTIVHYWIDGKLYRSSAEQLLHLFALAKINGYNWPALELAEQLFRITGEENFRQFSLETQKHSGLHSITADIKHEEPWQRALKALTAEELPSPQEPLHDFRIAWFVGLSEQGTLKSLVPKEQKLSAKGNWTKGRVIALKKLRENPPDYLGEQDRRICSALQREAAPWGFTVDFDLERALPALIGHPLIFLDKGPPTPVEFVSGQPELKVDLTGEDIQLSLYPFMGNEPFRIIHETPTRYRVIAVNRHHRRIARIIGEHGLKVPLSAKDKVFSTLNMVASQVSILSSIGNIGPVYETVSAQSRIHVHLLPVSSGFRVSFYVRPFETDGPYFKPGIGAEVIQVELKGRRVQAKRDLSEETRNARQVETGCPSLLIPEDETWEWVMLDPEQCLQVLYELRELGESVTVEWPEGKKMTVSPQISFDQFRGRIHKQQNWFELNGQITIDESLVLDMRRLLNLVKKSPGRFIPIGHGQFLTLTKEFRKRLEEINAFSEAGGGEGVRLHPLAAFTLDDLFDRNPHLQTDTHWQRQLENIRRAGAFHPTLPSTLQAELRDYQREGFLWLARLAQLGVGACLADDMGLGKTVQALAIILHRGAKGPTLVVAPTSVCLNWQAEATRFAPTLNCVLFGGRRRKKQLEKLGPLDLLITSYGMLQQEARTLAAIDWQTVILDEGQAIKNMATKRSKAAKILQGRFRLITTGTPIENHLGELWNLFDFINPGLLGSLDHFNEQFAVPIERHNDREARLRLKKVISPFVLRRIKSEVLDELPPKTEVVLTVQLTKEERAFYEAMRQEALASLIHIQGPEGHRNIKILAEIMKLRLACCNSRLISDAVKIASSKLEVFGSIVEELLDNRHKALVFSQFVGHLTLIREYLDGKKIPYRYMDGSTPAKKRLQEVELFQGGEGDLFLISLKAGGLGLNLTAADYVIHMDPWWNPAVEDQASDRAHRLGQKHPVTIYRLVSRNTIEEKIVALHRDKRELADSLLEGADMSGKISAEELLALLQQH